MILEYIYWRSTYIMRFPGHAISIHWPSDWSSPSRRSLAQCMKKIPFFRCTGTGYLMHTSNRTWPIPNRQRSLRVYRCKFRINVHAWLVLTCWVFDPITRGVRHLFKITIFVSVIEWVNLRHKPNKSLLFDCLSERCARASGYLA